MKMDFLPFSAFLQLSRLQPPRTRSERDFLNGGASLLNEDTL